MTCMNLEDTALCHSGYNLTRLTMGVHVEKRGQMLSFMWGHYSVCLDQPTRGQSPHPVF